MNMGDLNAKKALSFLRRRSRVIDRLILATPMQRVVHSYRRRAVLVRPVRFAALEFFGRSNRGALHRLRDSPIHVAVRHRSRDVHVFDDLFVGRPAYEPPSELAPLLTDGMSVLDLGGNAGLFGAFILSRFPNAKVTSVEPDPVNLPVIQRCIEANAASWRLIRACASSHNEALLFEPGRYAESRIVEVPSATTISVPAIDILPLLNSFDFVKIDIEGGEWPILDDPRFQGVESSIIVMEWHEAGCPYEDAFSAATAALNGAGYRTWGGFAGDSHGVTWAWRDGAVPEPKHLCAYCHGSMEGRPPKARYCGLSCERDAAHHRERQTQGKARQAM